jgi:hypothetical protein
MSEPQLMLTTDEKFSKQLQPEHNKFENWAIFETRSSVDETVSVNLNPAFSLMLQEELNV